MAVLLTKRYTCDASGYCYYTDWDNWIRWVVLAVVIVLFILIFALCSWQSARRRRRMGAPPYYGTGWTQYGHHGVPQYNPQNYAPPPPQYSQGVPDGHHGFYGGQHGQGGPGYELQQPPQSYGPSRGDVVEDYQPPAGPPPAKK